MPSDSINIAVAEARYIESQLTAEAVKKFLDSGFKPKRSRLRLMISDFNICSQINQGCFSKFFLFYNYYSRVSVIPKSKKTVEQQRLDAFKYAKMKGFMRVSPSTAI